MRSWTLWRINDCGGGGEVGGVGGCVPDDVPQMMVIDDLDMSRLSMITCCKKVPGTSVHVCMYV